MSLVSDAMMLEVAIEVLVLTLLSLTSSDDSERCEGTTDRLSKHLSTKTPYTYVANLATTLEKPSSCEPRQVWFISRHGTRYPSKKGLRLILDRLPEMALDIREAFDSGQVSLCPDTLSLLETWRPNAIPEDSKTLHPEGELEMILLAERYQSRFPTLLNSDYHPDDFTFRATASQRSSRSQFHFAIGLFGRKVAQADVRFEEAIRPHDPLIRFYKVCSRWQRDIKKNPESLREQRLFETSDYFEKNLLVPLSRRLGYKDLLTLNDVDALYNGCVFGQAWRPDTPSPWCQVFSQTEMQILEYREDLEYYWQSGYGYDLSHRQACVLVRNVLENFENVTRGTDDEENGIFYFSHSGAILKFLSYLGLYKDEEPLRHDNYDRMGDRLWRTSNFNSFGSNVAFVLQECTENAEIGYRVGLFVNERLVAIPGCGGQLWCQYETFARIFEESKTCVLEDLCAVEEDEEMDDEEAADEDKY